MITWDIIEILTERFFLGRGHSNKFFFGNLSFLFSRMSFGFDKAIYIEYNVVLVIFQLV